VIPAYFILRAGSTLFSARNMLLSTRLTGTIDNLHCHLMPYDLASEIDSSRIHPSSYTFNCRFCRIAMLGKVYKPLDHRHLFQRHPTQLKLHPTLSNSIQLRSIRIPLTHYPRCNSFSSPLLSLFLPPSPSPRR